MKDTEMKCITKTASIVMPLILFTFNATAGGVESIPESTKMAAEAVFGCGNMTRQSELGAQESISKAYGINFYEPYKKNREYQSLSVPINIKGISFDRVLFPTNFFGYTLKVASISDLKLLETAFHMRKQKPYRKNYDSIYVNLNSETYLSERQASVNYKNLTFTCRWRTELNEEAEPD